MRTLFLGLNFYLLTFFIIQVALRLWLLAISAFEIEFTGMEILQVLARGMWFDIAAAAFVLLPIVLLKWLLPARLWQTRRGHMAALGLRSLFLFVLLFDAVAELLFWEEFQTRFNFIAVDYLIYTQEVIGNIVESYPIGWIVGALALISVTIAAYSLRRRRPHPTLPYRRRLGLFAAYAALTLALYGASNAGQAQFNDNALATEIAANGMYNLFYAFWNNEISYDRFYAHEDERKIKDYARQLLFEENNAFENDKDLTRLIMPKGLEQQKNVMLVVMESMSADYMGVFGNPDGLTPNLDRLAREGFLFSRAYATGTRTVRGLEAVTLSVPPTPGQSIIRRPHNDNLFSLGFVFRDRGYDTRFIYGGYGYFDNMNTFFSGNGFDIIDRTRMEEKEIHFANVWGVADDDMFRRAVKEADSSYASGKHFLNLIMTTSNHRPYTYPEGRIDIPPKSGRLGGVKYADYSIGELMRMAQDKPWYKDTVFVFVADHTAGAGGKVELDPRKYHIPMIFYAPGFIPQGRYESIASQIDVAPILLGQLNWRYRTKFYGEDLLYDPDEIPHAFISNYQKVALVKEDRITILAPKRQITQYSWPEESPVQEVDDELEHQAIAYYQSASWWRDTFQRVNTVVR